MVQEQLPETAEPVDESGELDRANQMLEQVSPMIFGEDLRLQVVDPRSIKLLSKNARYMAKPVFDQLSKNVGGDGNLESTPLCHTLSDGSLEVLSGNHRVQAAIEAGLQKVLVLVIPQELPASQKVAKQLSHNAIAGEDDKQILASLWKDISSIEDKLYSGLDSRMVEELEKINFSAFSAVQIRSEKIVLWFLPEEVEDFDQLLDQDADVFTANEVYTAALAKYQDLFDMLVKVKRVRNIKNTAVAMMWLIDQLKEHVADKIDPPVEDDQETESEQAPQA